MEKEITKEEIDKLPLKRYEGELVVIDDAVLVDAAFEEIMIEKIVGVDTETKPTFQKGVLNKTSLIQIATSKKVFLFRIHKTGFSQNFIRLFESSSIVKIGIAIVQDFKELKGEYSSFEPTSVVDLNVWCKKIGFQNIGAKNLSAMVLGFRISKRQRVSNWELEELSDGQLYYAATDAWICREIYIKLKQSNF